MEAPSSTHFSIVPNFGNKKSSRVLMAYLGSVVENIALYEHNVYSDWKIDEVSCWGIAL